MLSRSIDRSDADEFLVHKLLNAVAGEFAAVAGVFDATEGQVCCGSGGMIDEDHPGIDAARHSFATLDVLSEDGASQAIIRIISECDGGILIFHPEEQCHGAEELLAISGIVRTDVR